MNAAPTWAGEGCVLRGGPIATLLANRPRSVRRGFQVAHAGPHLFVHLHSLIRGAIRELAGRADRTPRPPCSEQAAAATMFVCDHQAQFEGLYARLANDASREALVALLGSRMHGEPYRMPSAADDLALLRRHVVLSRVERDTRKPWRPILDRYCLRGEHGTIILQSDDQTLLHTLLREAYAYDHDGATVRAQPGDIVIDGGSRHGESAVYFADLAGPAGHVYAVEPESDNAALVGENLVLNPRVRDSVTVLNRVLGDRSGDMRQYRARGPAPGTMRIDQWGTPLAETPTISIDDLVERAELARVDFIKLDLGGWERRALAGAHRTLSQFRPALAVSVAHSLADLIDIPADLDRLAAGYALYLDDVSVQGDHPMLFAQAQGRSGLR